MALVRVFEDEEWIVDFDEEKKEYRVSFFEDFHFVSQCRFPVMVNGGVPEKEVPMPVKRFGFYNHTWWAGRCPRCEEIVRFDFHIDSAPGNRKHYCFRCGQLLDFEDIDVD